VVLISAPLQTYAQDRDTTTFFTLEQFLQQVEANHPFAVMARLERDLARQYLRAARGGFDPAISGDVRHKTYSESDYYTARGAALNIPTWMGLSFDLGWQQNDGLFLNPEATMPDAGLINAGVSLELGAGFLMDSRRAALRQAEIGLELGELERDILLNKLYVEATRVYLNWALSNRLLDIAEEAVRLADIRYQGVVESFYLGDVPAIDTVEAYTQVLNRLYVLRDQQTAWAEAINRAGAYLWNEDGLAEQIVPGVMPVLPPVSDEENERITGLAITSEHPKLKKLSGKRDQTVIERRLAEEYLRPKVALKYNFLSSDLMAGRVNEYFEDTRFFDNNYTFGAAVHFPLFMREARGKVGAALVKTEMIDRDYFNLQVNLEADFRAALVERANLRDQIDFYNQNVTLQQQLLSGEQELFFMGESSLFLVNARETSLITAQRMLLSAQAKLFVLEAKMREMAGAGF
jgi:outer membrane protein TolC